MSCVSLEDPQLIDRMIALEKTLSQLLKECDLQTREMDLLLDQHESLVSRYNIEVFLMQWLEHRIVGESR